MNKVAMVVGLTLLSVTGFAQKEISGVTPAKKIEISGAKLVFNGAGLREKMFLDLYVGTLYVSSKSSNATTVINSDQSMAITIDIVSGLISSEKMIASVNEGFENSLKGDTAPIKEKIESFKNAFKEEIIKGDHFVIAYVKGVGTEVHKNGRKIKTIEGIEFKKALFGIWFCDEPADEDLKEGMLGKS